MNTILPLAIFTYIFSAAMLRWLIYTPTNAGIPTPQEPHSAPNGKDEAHRPSLAEGLLLWLPVGNTVILLVILVQAFVGMGRNPAGKE